ncbi:26S proteasome non-ATPase regulatory subunit 2-like [Agrilus planipennis]|uniref:26S proteasome non-ATPase regulatory subunit 2 n=1 Tax=Agrilus planipennis TaxID=224129 RepID=A0A1W4XHW6_AGRPL|nr:26S proteasome non-ATPase regulatory subunit 2-like [Agrilus planipennis]
MSKKVNNPQVEESEEDKELQEELKMLVDRITGTDQKLIKPALNMLRTLIKTSTTSMTSVPKPLKYLGPYYNIIKANFKNIEDADTKKLYADIISVLAMSPTGGDDAKQQHDCLRYRLLGHMKNVGSWGHEYVRQLETEIVEQWSICSDSGPKLMPLVQDIVSFDCNNHAEIQACDVLMEIDRLEILPKYIDNGTYQRICLYLMSCAKYVDDVEATKILKIVADQYKRFEEYPRALVVALQLRDKEMVDGLFADCKDPIILKQMAFIAARQLHPVNYRNSVVDQEEIGNILSNNYLNSHFVALARELDILEPKTPEDVYKTWLEPQPVRPSILGENLDSARQNLASSFVNGFVNAGFGSDKLLTTDTGNKWIYRNKDHAMLSTTAALGLIHLWDVDGGLTPIDKYLYSADENIKAGALLAIGMVNCRVSNECDPALALLADHVNDESQSLRIGAIYGLGMAYAGSAREDVLNILVPVVESAIGTEILAISSLAAGLVAVGTCNAAVTNAVLSKLVDIRESETLKSPLMRLTVLGMALCYMGRKDCIETPNAALEVFTEPFKSTSQLLLQMCAYAGTGDVLVIQELLRVVSERIALPDDKDGLTKSPSGSSGAIPTVGVTDITQQQQQLYNHPLQQPPRKKAKIREWDMSIPQAVAALAVAAVAVGEETGTEMCQRVLGHVGRYGDHGVHKAVPLAIALTSVSNPQLTVNDVLTKYSHDSDDEVAANAIFSLGIVGAGTNNARLSAGLRQLAVYHSRNPTPLFMVRFAQGLTHMGKGTLTISPLHHDRQLIDPCAMAGLLITLTALLDSRALINGKNHFLLYVLAVSMQPRWLLTLDEELQSTSVPVRVGQAVDVVGKAGTPKTISGIHTHTTPVLLAAGERAEIATDLYEQMSPTLDGVCILRKKKLE